MIDVKEILLEHNKDRDLILRCNELVERFIAERGLIVYGGTAIDFGLRAAGAGHIYEEHEFTDYDMFTPNWLRDAYDMAAAISLEFGQRDPATNLVTKPNTDIRVINGIHLRTLRVEFLSIFVADFSYCPAAVFSLIPRGLFKTRRGVEVAYVMPTAQAIDMHAALSGPWDDPPMEVYSHRAIKDIGRFNKLIALVAPAPKLRDAKPQRAEAKIEHPKAMCVGLTAHFLLLEWAAARGYKPRTKGVVKIANEQITLEFEGPAPWPVELMTERLIEFTHQRVLDWIPKSARADGLWLYESGHALYAHYEPVDGAIVTAEAVQGVLMMLLAHSLCAPLYGLGDATALMSDFFLSCYWDLLAACDHICGGAGSSASEKTAANDIAPFLLGTGAWPSIDAPNESPALMYSRAMTLANIADRSSKDTGMSGEVSKVLGMRPPNLRWNVANFEQQSARFLAWTPAISAYLCDGRAIEKK